MTEKNEFGFTVKAVKTLVAEFDDFDSKNDWCDSVEFVMMNGERKFAVRIRLVDPDEEDD